MVKGNVVLLILILPIFFFSCVKNLNLDIKGGDNLLVVNATLCPDSTISLTLSKSKNVLDNSNIEYIDDANIYVYESNILVDTLKSIGIGRYMGKINPIINKEYTINVKSVSQGEVEATDTIPELVKIQNIEKSIVNNGSAKLLNCAINIADPINTENFYLLKVMSADISNPGRMQVQNFTSYDPSVKGSVVADTLADGIVFFKDSQFNGNIHSTLISMSYPQNKIVYFQLWSISRALYNYCSSIANNRGNNTSLFNEKTKVMGNIEGGLGIMAAYSISTSSIWLE